jgi:hypothetical protein
MLSKEEGYCEGLRLVYYIALLKTKYAKKNPFNISGVLEKE